MRQKKVEKRRYDDKRIRLQKGEIQRPNGTYEFRWTTPDGKRHSVYAPTIVQLREQERLVIVDEHDGKALRLMICLSYGASSNEGLRTLR